MDCKCGCGQKTNLAVRNNAKLGYVKGEPYNYCNGHRPANTKPLRFTRIHGGRIEIKTKTGWDREYRVIAEKVLGRKLKSTEDVHHKDEDPLNDEPDNLQVCTHSEHRSIHARTRRELKTKQWLATLKIG